ncbi:MAG: 16S rRNA (cytosine(1402)-N(4))-methyltransferase RsmH [bacterium]
MHQAVLLNEVMTGLAPRPGGLYVDGTLGGGGHSRAIAGAIGPAGRLLAIDQDAGALERARRNLTGLEDRCTLAQGSFARMDEVAQANGFGRVDGVLLDIGISSDQLDDPDRGFSFMRDGPLDMRMDQGRPTTAADLLNTLPEYELADLLRVYGEEPRARAIARQVVRKRVTEPFCRTSQLADLVMGVYGGRRGRIHPATLAFQALRIVVNGELEALEKGLEAGLRLLAPGGRFAVITFHSLEDRMVKQFFVEHQGRFESLPEGGQKWVGQLPAVKILTRKPVMAAEEECRENPRARSAKLRIAERKDS